MNERDIKMKRKLLVIMLIAAWTLAGCGNVADNTESIPDETVSSTQDTYESESKDTDYMPESVSESESETDTESGMDETTIERAKEAARTYYADTVFEVISLETISQTGNEIVFSVCVSKGGVVQEPNRTIILQLDGDKFEVTSEGY